MTEYDETIMKVCKWGHQQEPQKGIISKMVKMVKEELPWLTLGRRKISAHVRICMGIVKHGGVFDSNHKYSDEVPRIEPPAQEPLVNIDTTGMSKYAAKQARKRALEDMQ